MKKILVVLAVSMALFANQAVAQLPVVPLADQQTLLKSSNKKLAKNKKLVYDFWREVFEGGHMELADKYLAESYMQHNPGVATGRKAFVDLFSQWAKPQAIADVVKAPIVSIVAEGDLVSVFFVRELPDPNDATKKYTTTWFDMFRIENGKIAEHWDAAEKRKM